MNHKWRLPKEWGIFSVLVLVYIVFGILSPNFLTASNTFTLLLNGSVVGLLAIGQTFVLLTAGIDLSVGSGIALSGVMAAIAMAHGAPWYLAMMAALICTILIGLFNGVVIHYVKVPAFIVTFATMGVASSIPMILTQDTPIPITSNAFSFIGEGFVGPVPVPVILMLGVAVIAYLILSRSVFGLHIYAVGGNRESARLAGVNTAKVDLMVYMLSGLMAGLGGLVDASRLMSGYPTAGSGTSLFFSISAAVVGGVSLFGGVGTILGAVIGAILIAVVSNGLDILNVSSYWQPLVIGLIILAGVTMDILRTSRSENRSFWDVLQKRLHMNRQAEKSQPSPSVRP